MPRATSLAAAIKDELGVEAELIKGDAGVFDVFLDGELIFSKHAEGRYPEPAEVVSILRG